MESLNDAGGSFSICGRTIARTGHFAATRKWVAITCEANAPGWPPERGRSSRSASANAAFATSFSWWKEEVSVGTQPASAGLPNWLQPFAKNIPPEYFDSQLLCSLSRRFCSRRWLKPAGEAG